MEKAQVTIAVRASRLQGPLGEHVCSAYIGTDGNARCVVFLTHDLGEDREVGRFYFPLGAMSAHNAEVLALELGNVLYDYLLGYCGIQPELPVAID